MADCSNSSSNGSANVFNDEDIIPGTPDILLNESRRRKMSNGRSFLSSSRLLQHLGKPLDEAEGETRRKKLYSKFNKPKSMENRLKEIKQRNQKSKDFKLETANLALLIKANGNYGDDILNNYNINHDAKDGDDDDKNDGSDDDDSMSKDDGVDYSGRDIVVGCDNDANDDDDDDVVNPDDDPVCYKYGRHRVISVESSKECLALDLKCFKTGSLRKALLYGFWTDTRVKAGNCVNVIGRFDENSECRITDQENFIVVSPDILVSGTSVTSAVTCLRKMVLSDKFKHTNTGKLPSMLHGTISNYHNNNTTTTPDIRTIAEEIISRRDHMIEMFALGVQLGEAVAHY
ncbi:hypothetical protein HELRODRAFT_181752 [Helobdella robusta]|uniref:DNA replication factor Dna2 N-terminal domain-containing protein n=1 Tax=Helobdella robusta TaxID=6412 RepID=T1FHA3_HELRO|nr:hypothetical protein HELRODRAFT_181752 [Helobdella robusta]ESN92132.1 hypothetical protein HELRODRAFT_181752 [Helobdella robusta]